MPFQRSTLGLALVLFAVVDGRAAERIPVDAFFQNPEIASPIVSPGGRYVAFLSPVEGRISVILLDLSTGKVEPVTRAYDADITEIFWKGDDRIVCSADPNGRESPAIFTYQLATKSVKILAEPLHEHRPDAAFAWIVDRLDSNPTHILVYGRTMTRGWTVGLFDVNLLSADRFRVFGYDPDTTEWAADGNGDVRYRVRQDGSRTIHEVRPEAASGWKPIAEFGDGIDPDLSPVRFVAFAAGDRSAFLTRADREGHDALYRLDLETREWGPPLFRSENGPIAAVRLSWDHARVEGVRYGPEERDYKWLDPRLAKVFEALRASFPAHDDITIESADRNENIFTVSVRSDLNPGEYYLLDLRGKTQLVQLGRRYPRIPCNQLRPMKPIEFRARDGLTIHGYLTLPANAAGRRVPLVLLPHGGPYGIRDVWGYNPEVQFIASRGYAVLQPNYRGSGGYGEAFLLAGRREWGGRMQDDLSDAVAWAVAQGFADPKRVCIYGASYGGYAALAGAVFTPDLYRCAVNYAGVSDLTLIASWQNEMTTRGKAYYHHLVGDDKTALTARSPINFVDRIKVPTLHAYGENDPRVLIKNWHELEAKLKKYGKIYEVVYEGNEGHGFHTEAARINFYRHLEAFLDKNL